MKLWPVERSKKKERKNMHLDIKVVQVQCIWRSFLVPCRFNLPSSSAALPAGYVHGLQ
jgi:hypothetical protein